MPKNPASTRENPFLNLILSVIVPGFILSKLSGPEQLGPVNALLVALAFPIGYAIYDFAKRRKVNFISGLGFISTLLTGVFALYQLSADWIAIKEASIPLIIGIGVLLSLKTRSPLVEQLLYNENVVNVQLVSQKLRENGREKEFAGLMKRSSIILAFSFLVSAILNYGLARYLLVSQPGTPEFNAELGRMTYLSWPVIVLPSTFILFFALWRLLKGLRELTGLQTEEILNAQSQK